MIEEHGSENSDNASTSHQRKLLVVAVIMLPLISAAILIRDHWSHVAGYWPYLLLLACPLMHLLHGRGGHGSHKGDSNEIEARTHATH